MNVFSLITKPFGCLMSLIGSVVVLALLLLVAGWFGVGLAMDPMVERHWNEMAPGETSVDSVRFQPFRCALVFEGLSVINPDPFPKEPMLTVDRAEFETNWAVLMEERTAGEALPIESAEIVVSRISLLTMNDRTNLEGLPEAWGALFGAALTGDETAPESVAREEAGGSHLHAFDQPLKIERLTVRIISVEVGTAQGGRLQMERFPLNYVREFSDVTSWRPVVEMVAADLRTLGRRRVANAIDPEVDLLEEGPEGLLRRGLEGVRDILEKADN